MTSTRPVGDFRGREPDRGAGQGLAWHLRQPVVPLAKRALRGYGMVTASRRPLPDFLVIGAKRGGSTSLFRNLVTTPGVLGLFPGAEDLKGTYYFDVYFGRGERWYRSHFPSERARWSAGSGPGDGPALAGEASPYYLAHPHAAARAARLVPGARIVALLRDPVARAHSHYRERVRQGIETLPSFAAAVEAEPARLAGELERMAADPAYVSWNHLNFGYLAQSDYGPMLARWRARFPPEQVLVLRSEDFYVDPAGTIDRVRGFLGLAPCPPAAPRHYNRLPAPDLHPSMERELRARFPDELTGVEPVVAAAPSSPARSSSR